MRIFYLERDEDKTGISGTGKVAQGVEFDSLKVVLCWLTAVASIGVYDSIKQVEAIHGHDGATRIVFYHGQLLDESHEHALTIVEAA